MADPARAARLAQRIKVIVAEALRRRVKDERAELITVTDARVTNDLQHATVYYTVMGDDDARRGAEEVLAAHKGAVRHEMGKQLTIRLTPTIEFVADEIPESAAHLEDLLRKAREQDEQVAALREQAAPAGGEDPYRSMGEGSEESEHAGSEGVASDGTGSADER
ncbi:MULTISPECIES: 30S ribosome-binding factor RbfA [Nesterenkonia]|uniref:Ribosome-binding factor A n=1 Tax=Nesterenkonia xinjiangensis TaxID=225327 RepID=A0A7Z0GPV6_9MICC|nr:MULTISPECIES: 30S ribosome-binding factor RbfA [Nesterenkonia]MDZ5076121.1 30S ribosome-binding factor RbfA [Nesterenkonia sp. HG001]NYJ79096.1 ribosome-binding factor A [Nesterenkonia xinjiangensis]